jgi:hypothetical protein
MFIMNSKWLTFWTLEYTFIWIILRKILPCNDFITKINPIYLLLLIAYGYLAIVFYQLLVNKTYYEFSFLMMHILFHFIPLFVFQMFFKMKGNLLFSSLFVVAYLCYIIGEKMTLYDIYLSKRHMKSFKDLEDHIKENKNSDNPVHNLFRRFIY